MSPTVHISQELNTGHWVVLHHFIPMWQLFL